MKVLLTTCFFFFSIYLFAQQSTPLDSRLLAVYDRAYLEQLQSDNPFLLERLHFYLDNAWYLSDYPEDKGGVEFPVVQINDLASINILLLEKEQGLQKDYQTEVVYSINGTRKVLIYRSGRDFNRLLNEHLQRTYSERN
ncbi:MAG: hypothetical protein IPL49_08885 [Saprospirales bacterium]|nr:hypothetical protein [Saprospirales bacterium]MBK8490986.1 hypothetical protein [Saprospirales bacterium]